MDAGGARAAADTSGHCARAEPTTEPQIPAEEETRGGRHQATDHLQGFCGSYDALLSLDSSFHNLRH